MKDKLWRNVVALVAFAACAQPEPETGESRAALTAVTWTDLVGASASGNDLTKTAPESSFNAGAVSVETLSGDGFVEFTTGESTTDKLAGLSVGNGGQGYADIDFAIRLNASGRASVYEGGVNVVGIGPYAAGDVFRVQVESGVVTYWRNGALKYTSTATPAFPLLVDTSLKTPGATINDVVLEGVVFWRDVVRAEASGNDLVKTSTLGSWNAGAASIATIPGGDGYVQFTAGEANTAKMAGLSTGNSGQSYTDIDFAISLSDTGGVAVYEGGNGRGSFGPYAAGDVFQVRVTGGVVTYWRNGVSFYTSALAPTYPLLLDTSLKTPGATIFDAAIGTGAAPNCAPAHQTLLGSAPSERLGTFDVAGGVMAVADVDSDTTAATVYRRSASGWQFEASLSGDVAGTTASVATDGQTIAALVMPDGTTQRIALVYRFDGVQWAREDVLQPCPEDVGGFTHVAVQGDLLAFGVDHSIVNGTEGGRTYVHRRVGSSWVLEGILTHDAFAILWRRLPYIAVGGSWVAAASYYEVHMFRHDATLPDPPQPPSCSLLDPGKWSFRRTLVPSGYDSIFLSSIDMNPAGTRVIAGETRRENVFVFDRNGGWNQTADLRAIPADWGIGQEVALGGPDPEAKSIVVTDSRVFAEQAFGWRQVDTLPTSIGSRGVTADEIFVGATSDDTAGTDAGAIRVFGMDPLCFPQ